MHARKAIRDAVVTALTGLATTGANVFASRPESRPLPQSSLPALRVFTVDEVAEPSGMSRPRTLARSLTLGVEASAIATSALDDALDGICDEVETALGNTKPAAAKDLRLLSTVIEFDGGAEQPVGRARMEFLIDYQTPENAPGTIV